MPDKQVKVVKHSKVRAVVDVSTRDETVRDALEKMHRNHLSAIPIYFPIQLRKKYLGFMQPAECLPLLMSLPSVQQLLSKEEIDVFDGDLLAKDAQLLNVRLEEYLKSNPILNASEVLVENGDPLEAIVDRFARGTGRVLIAPRTGGGPSIHHEILSHSDVLKYLIAHGQEALQQIFSMRLSQVGYHSVAVLRAGVPALLGFDIMHARKHSTIGIVNDSGQLIDILSATDVRALPEVGLRALSLPIAEYLPLVHAARAASALGAIHYCTPSATVLDAANMMVNNHIHRIFICEHHKPVGIVTMTELLTLFAPSTSKFHHVFGAPGGGGGGGAQR
eukprot:tig00021135_g18949.t1